MRPVITTNCGLNFNNCSRVNLLNRSEGVMNQLLLSNASALSWREQANCQLNDDEVRFVLDQHA